jgi:solute carrier family 35 protein C2
MAFPYPLLLTSSHFLFQWGGSHLLLGCGEKFTHDGSSQRQIIKTMSWATFCATSVPCGLVSAGDIGCSNLSIVTLSISLYTMVKASTPIFVVMWAFLFGVERITLMLMAVLSLIVLGEYLTIMGEGQHDIVVGGEQPDDPVVASLDTRGIALCLGSALLSGARWTLVQLKLRTMEPPLTSAVGTMRLLSPSIFGGMFVLAMAVERPWEQNGGDFFVSMEDSMKTLAMGLMGAFLAMNMILCELELIMRTNAFVLMIGGVVKEIFTIWIGIALFGDPWNALNAIGCAVVFSGVILYKLTVHGHTSKSVGPSTTSTTVTDHSHHKSPRHDEEKQLASMEMRPLALNYSHSSDSSCLSKSSGDSSDNERSPRSRKRQQYKI